MNLEEIKQLVREKETDNKILVEFLTTKNNEREQITYFTSILKKNCKKGKVWKSKEFFITLKNLKYGIDYTNFRSKGGKDGIFIIDRNYRPRNNMQKKIFNQFIDKENSGIEQILNELNIPKTEINAVRIVSHHMRLLGIHYEKDNQDIIILVDYDNTK